MAKLNSFKKRFHQTISSNESGLTREQLVVNTTITKARNIIVGRHLPFNVRVLVRAARKYAPIRTSASRTPPLSPVP
jgi:hypothetical protein